MMPSELHVAFDTLRARLQADVETQLASFRTVLDRSAADPQPDSSPTTLHRLVASLRAVSAASSLTAALDALADAARVQAPLTALYLLGEGPGGQGDVLTRWRSSGFHDEGGQPSRELIDRVVRTQEAVATGPAQPGAEPHRAAVVVPLIVGEQVVALLYAEGEIDGSASGWTEALQILTAHASACVARVTATRWAQVLASSAPAHITASAHDESAQRYARLLVSEIKLYNESAVRAGRDGRDLLLRLRPEIDRARQLYEARVPASVRDRAALFHQELVATLAAGDASLLGVPA